MHWIPNSSSKCLALGLALIVGLALAAGPSVHAGGGWTRPLLVGEVDSRTGYAAQAVEDRIYILSGAATPEGTVLNLWSTDPWGATRQICTFGPLEGNITGLSLTWFDSHWHVVWGVDQVGIFHARVDVEGKGSEPQLVIPAERPLGRPFLVAGTENLHLVWNSMCEGPHAVYWVFGGGDGTFSSVPHRLSEPGIMTTVTDAAFVDDTLHLSWQRYRETWAELVVFSRDREGQDFSEQVGITSTHHLGSINLALWPSKGVLLAWPGGTVIRGRVPLARPMLGVWQGEEWQLGPLEVGEGASQITTVQTAGQDSRALVVWIELLSGRLTTRYAWLTREGEMSQPEPVVWDDREFLDPRPFIVSGRAVLLASLRTQPSQNGIFLMLEDDQIAPPWWLRWGLNPLDPWGDAVFKLLVGMMTGILASALAIPALLIGMGAVVFLERCRFSAGFEWRSLIVFLLLWICRQPGSWPFAQLFPINYPEAYVIGLFSALVVLFLGRVWRWPDSERLYLLGRGVAFVILNNWLTSLVAAKG